MHHTSARQPQEEAGAAGLQPGARSASVPDAAPTGAVLPLLDRFPVIRRLEPGVRARLTEVVRFLTVGGMNWVVDLVVFNLVRALTGGQWVIAAKVVSVSVATLFSWVVNRSWTFRARATDSPRRELVGFVVVNLAGMVPPLGCLWFSHHLMGWTSVLADNISANVVGLVLGTVLRYFGYRLLVFTGHRD